ncbi:hypothetical protein HAZT_HAZT002230 [Hyalella azteca]|uniref:Amine oxidase domain-containing protein n=1 Tax=Hyalella azteca TaxID=294128 RepID=A0A6A0H3Y5_HYAAZ|nr:hypothetical protein HAZT_HAZT002230 [Hyalella azteca]
MLLVLDRNLCVLLLGHNGLVCGAYLARAGKKVCILERRHIVGGAAVTEEIIPGFKFSRASYVLGLLRPHIVKDLELAKYGLEVRLRDPHSYTPLLENYWQDGKGKSLMLGSSIEQNSQQIAQFSTKDAAKYPEYEAMLGKFADAIAPLLDTPAPHLGSLAGASLMDKLRALPALKPILKTGGLLGPDLPLFQELLTAPTSRVLDHWFESEPLKATLATDSVIGAFISPSTPGSGYVLLHHAMAETGGVKGAWGNPVGGMGAVTSAMARSAQASGAHIFTNMTECGKRVQATSVLCSCTPHTALLSLLPPGVLPEPYEDNIRATDYTSPVCKINVALKSLPNFKANPNSSERQAARHLGSTIHLNCERSDMIETAYQRCLHNLVPDRPLLEMTIPSSLDPTIAPAGCHVALFFTQYLPYAPQDGPWDQQSKDRYAKQVFSNVDEYAPGFSDSVVGYEVLTPPDLENIFALRGGNIFHGSMSLDRLFWSRPSPLMPGPRTPVPGLLLCGAGSHPGGGVMGSPGYIAAQVLLADRNRK